MARGARAAEVLNGGDRGPEPIVRSRRLRHHGRELARAGRFRVVRCRPCGFAHLLPLPSAREAASLYRRHYYARAKPTYLVREREEQAYWAIEHREKLHLMERMLGRCGRRRVAATEGCRTGRRLRLLDLGCSGGFFLLSARRAGWDGVGIECSSQAAAHARRLGIEVIERDFDEIDWAGLGRFHAVHAKLVLEHVRDPAGLLASARSVLRPGGVICVQVPNDFSPLQAACLRALGKRSWWVAPPYHVNYFDFASLRSLLGRTGFAVELETTNFPMEAFLLMGEDYVGNEAVGYRCHVRRMRLEIALEQAGLGELRRGAYRSLAALGIGREAIVYARAV